MRTPREQRDQRWAERWLRRSGGFDHVSPEALDLLSRRLRARRRAFWICSPLFLIAVAVLVSDFWIINDAGSEPALGGRFVLAAGLVASGLGLAVELGRRADVRLGASLVHPVTRAEPVPFWWMFGSLRSAFLIVMLGLQATLAALLAHVAPGWVAADYALGLVVAGSVAAVGIWRAATRPTLAVDDVSLAIDERFRSEDAYIATGLLFLLPLMLPASAMPDSLPGWFVTAWFVSFAAVQVLWAWGLQSPPWRRALRTAGY